MNDDDAGGEDVAHSEHVAGRTPEQHQRRKEQHVAVVDPLRVDQRGSEVGADRRQGERDHRAVDETHAGRQDRRDQHKTPAFRGAESRGRRWLGELVGGRGKTHARGY
jgi:hypothetical protein